MLLAVFVCTYFKKKKKKPNTFSDIVRSPYCLLFLVAAPFLRLEANWWRRRGGEGEGRCCEVGMPLGNTTFTPRTLALESFSLKFSCWDIEDCLRELLLRDFWDWLCGEFFFFEGKVDHYSLPT